MKRSLQKKGGDGEPKVIDQVLLRNAVIHFYLSDFPFEWPLAIYFTVTFVGVRDYHCR